MTTLPEEAVKAYIKAFGNTPRTKAMALKNEQKVRHALTAALPFLPVQGAVKKLEDAALSESVNSYAANYEFRGDNGDYTPTDGERAMIEDAIQGFIADAGKVEGDGWLPIESAPKDGTVIQVWHQVHKCPVSVLWKDDGFPYRGKRLNWYERTYTTAWPEHVFFYWRPLPSAPSQEVAGS